MSQDKILKKNFGDLNRKKLPVIFTVISAIFLFFVLSIILITGFMNNDFPEVEGFFYIILGFGVGIPLFLIMLGYLSWHYNRWVRQKMMRKSPYNKLSQIGFTTSYIDAGSKFFFTEDTLETNINGYRIQFNVNNGTPKTAEFTAFVQHSALDKEKYGKLEQEFKKEEIYFDFDGLIKKYNSKKSSTLTAEQLEASLSNFIKKLQEEGFTPR